MQLALISCLVIINVGILGGAFFLFLSFYARSKEWNLTSEKENKLFGMIGYRDFIFLSHIVVLGIIVFSNLVLFYVW